MDERFHAALAELQADLRQASGLRLVWKDADPARWLAGPVAVVQHRGAYCRAVKRASGRLQRCIAHDNRWAGDWPDRPPIVLRSCPFGITEAVIRVSHGHQQVGCAMLGQWRSAEAAPAVAAPVWQGLPPLVEAEALAHARLVARLLAGLAHLRDEVITGDDPRLLAARRFIDAHLTAGLRAAAVAHHLHLSTSRFVHWFASAGGVPFTTWVAERLMRRAAILLADPEKTVTAVAGELGYATLPAFTAAFRRVHGEAPAHWRHRMARAEA